MHLLGQSRRRFLQAAAALAATTPLARMLTSSVAHADDGAVPCRLLLIYTPHGTSYPHWRPQVSGSDFTLDFPDSILAPLEPFKSKLCVVEGLEMLSAYAATASGHEGGMASMFTGGNRITGNVDGATHQSIDRIVAEHLQSENPAPNDRVNFVMGLDGTFGYGTSAFYEDVGGQVQPVVGESNTLAIFNRLFDGVSPDGPDPAALALVARKQSILDTSRSQIQALQATVGAKEKAKLEAHLDAIADLEARLDLPIAACTPPEVEGSGDEFSFDHSPDAFPRTIDELSDIVTQSLACRLTHVAGLQLLYSTSGDPMPFIGINYDTHNELAHGAVAGGSVIDSEPYRTDYLEMQTFWAQTVADLLGRLDAITEENGKTLLDNTIVCWTSDMGDPALHSNVDLPIVLAGGAGQIEMGRYLQYYFSDGSHNPHLDGTGGTPHNHLLTSLCRKLGMDIDGVGNPAYSGWLEEL